jgi:hypothetical protein
MVFWCDFVVPSGEWEKATKIVVVAHHYEWLTGMTMKHEQVKWDSPLYDSIRAEILLLLLKTEFCCGREWMTAKSTSKIR